jgi:hypothetical protein
VLLLVLTAHFMVWRRPTAVRPLFRITHLLPALLQAAIFSYWFLHRPTGRELVPTILATLALAVPIDAAVSSLVHGEWRPSFGPLPIVLSTNLFAQFFSSTWWVGMIAVTIALASKYLIRHSERHVLNPSAFGLFVVGWLDLGTEAVSTPDFAAQFSVAPLMPELILSLALIVQLRLRLVLVTLGAAVGLLALPSIFPFDDSSGHP